MKVLLVLPPMTQLNTPYPSTAYLCGFLRSKGVDARQMDLAMNLTTRLFTRSGLERIRDAGAKLKSKPPALKHFLDRFDDYRATVEPAVRFLQGREPSFAYRIVGREFLPEGPRFGVLEAYEGEDPLAWAFGVLGLHDRARHLATLYIDDVAAAITAVAPHFELVRYAESLAASEASFDPLQTALEGPPTVVDAMLDELAAEAIALHRPRLLALSVPFAGNVYGALRIARAARKADPNVVIAMGGGYVNTELREIADPRVFDYVDYICLDDGERPIQSLIERIENGSGPLCRTFARVDGEVVFEHDPELLDVPFAESADPTWDGLPMGDYLSVLEMLNPMHRVWSDTRWNKLTVAHGCYWKKCAFCDVTLDYIGRYEPVAAKRLVARVRRIIDETGQSGFHLVDEAAPPGPLRAFASELLEQQVPITFWGNIRFEKAFDPELCALLAQAGCIAVSGGLEVAHDRLLNLMQKGVSVAQVARVTRAFTDAGIMVHAYLMYGFPTQTVGDTVDALEYVRQLFEAGCLQSAFWHRFALTVHSPIAKDPAKFGVQIEEPPVSRRFARNDIPFVDTQGADHDKLAPALEKALYNYMHGIGVDQDVRVWFDGLRVPRTTVPPDFVERALAEKPKKGKKRA